MAKSLAITYEGEEREREREREKREKRDKRERDERHKATKGIIVRHVRTDARTDRHIRTDARTDRHTACMPSFPERPIPTSAACSMLTSFAPSPMARHSSCDRGRGV